MTTRPGQARRQEYLARDGDLWVERVFEGDQALESHVLSGLEGRVADVWAEVDAEADPNGNA